jgi:hypothetical protein
MDYPLNPMQHAYLKGKSTETALHYLVHKIDGSLAQKEIVLGVFIDVEGSFDNTSFESMDYVQNWCDEIGLNVNADKTSMVLFTKKEEFGGFFRPKTKTL